ncbi:MAG: DUF72 domain-containing protein [Pseudonocardiaceae bacterium]
MNRLIHSDSLAIARIATHGWRGTFYPPGLPRRRELEYLARRVNTVEINGSFYSLQRPASYQSWAAATPEDFVFAVKGGRFITLATFFALLPRSTAEAATLAQHHDQRLEDRAWTRTDADRPLRHALEVRHPSYRDPAMVELLRAHDVALVMADTAGTWPYLEDVTADFVYVRLHGDSELYVSGYTDEALDVWAERIRGWQAGRSPRTEHTIASPAPLRPRDVFVYFDNDAKVHAPADAISLTRKLA